MSICSVCKNPEMENILEAPTLPFRTWAFLSPAPHLNAVKANTDLPGTSTSALQPAQIILDHGTYLSRLATMPS